MKKQVIFGLCALIVAGSIQISYANNIEPKSVTATSSYSVNAKTSNQKMKTTTSLNIRSGPSTKYKTLGKLKKGTTITVTSTTGSWSKFTYNGKKAYVSTKYLQKVISSSTTNNTSKQKMKTTSSLNVRSGPSTKYKTLGKLKKGATITVTSTTGSWGKFTYNGKTAYVSTKYLKKVTSSNESTKYPIAKNVTASKLRVRKFKMDAYIRESTTKGSKIIGIGKKGNMIEYVKLVKTGLHKVIFNGKYAYIEDYEKDRDVFEMDAFGNLNSNTTNKYVKNFDILAEEILDEYGWFWKGDSAVTYKYGLVNFGSYNSNTLASIGIYTDEVNREKESMRKEALLKLLTTIFGNKEASNIYKEIFNSDYQYLRKTYNGVTIDIEKDDYVTLIYF